MFPDFQYFAHKAGKTIGLTVLNIDDEIFQAAAYDHLASASTLKELINSTYDKYIPQLSFTASSSIHGLETIDDGT